MATTDPRTQSDTVAVFVAAVRDRMDTLGISGSELARRAGVSQPRISELLNGGKSPNLTTVGRIADALDTTASDLLQKN